MSNTARKLVLSAALTAIIALLTMLSIRVTGGGAYIHPGDAAIYLASWLLGGWWGAAAAAIGSALADLMLGATQYAPATFVIKGAMALIAWGIIRISPKSMVTKIIAMVTASLFMVAGYFGYEFCLFGLTYALTSLPFNLIQLVGGTAIGIPLLHYGSKIREISTIHESNYHL